MNKMLKVVVVFLAVVGIGCSIGGLVGKAVVLDRVDYNMTAVAIAYDGQTTYFENEAGDVFMWDNEPLEHFRIGDVYTLKMMNGNDDNDMTNDEIVTIL